MRTVVHWVPNFRLFRSMISRFWDIPHFTFPIDSYLKISKCHKIFKTWPIAKKRDSLYSTMVANVLKRFGWHQMKNVGEAFRNFWAPYGPVLRKISKCHRIFIFWQIAKKSNSLYQPQIMILCMKFGLNLMNCWRSVSKSWNRKLCKVHWMAPNQTQGIGHEKYPTYVQCSRQFP